MHPPCWESEMRYPTRSPFIRDFKISKIRPRHAIRTVETSPLTCNSPVPQTMYWSHTEIEQAGPAIYSLYPSTCAGRGVFSHQLPPPPSHGLGVIRLHIIRYIYNSETVLPLNSEPRPNRILKQKTLDLIQTPSVAAVAAAAARPPRPPLGPFLRLLRRPLEGRLRLLVVSWSSAASAVNSVGLSSAWHASGGWRPRSVGQTMRAQHWREWRGSPARSHRSTACT